MSRATVLVTAGHKPYRDGLARAIRRHRALELLAVSGDARSALDGLAWLRPDVCLVDVALRPWGGLELCRRACVLPGASARFVLMASDPGPALAYAAAAVGADCVVDKDAPRAQLCDVLVEVVSTMAR